MSSSLRLLAIAIALCGAATAASARYMSYEIIQSPEVNNYLSQRYDWLLETNWAFRQYRMRKECGPINILPLHGDCISSFDTYEPFRGRGW